MDILNVMDGINYAAKENGYNVYGTKIRVVFDEDTYHDIDDDAARNIVSGVEINGDALPMLATAVSAYLKSDVYDDELRDIAFDIASDTTAWVLEMREGGVLVTCDGEELTGLTDERIHETVLFKIAGMLWPVFPVAHIISRNTILTATAASAIVFDAEPIGFPFRWNNPVEIGDYEGVRGVEFLEKNGELILELFDSEDKPIVAVAIEDTEGKREIFSWAYTCMKDAENPEICCEIIQGAFLSIK